MRVNSGVGMGRAQDLQPGMSGQDDIVCETALAAEQPGVFYPQHRLADPELHRRSPETPRELTPDFG